VQDPLDAAAFDPDQQFFFSTIHFQDSISASLDLNLPGPTGVSLERILQHTFNDGKRYALLIHSVLISSSGCFSTFHPISRRIVVSNRSTKHSRRDGPNEINNIEMR